MFAFESHMLCWKDGQFMICLVIRLFDHLIMLCRGNIIFDKMLMSYILKLMSLLTGRVVYLIGFFINNF